MLNNQLIEGSFSSFLLKMAKFRSIRGHFIISRADKPFQSHEYDIKMGLQSCLSEDNLKKVYF